MTVTVDGPVFLLASERSGTNFLRTRLTDYQRDIFGPAPLHFLKHLYHAEPYYGDLGDDKNFDEFIRVALGLAYHHFSPWEEKISVSQVRESYEGLTGGGRSAIGVMHAMYAIYAQRSGYTTYLCKDNNLFDFVSDIRMVLPKAKFMYLHRDPRDVVLSQLKRPLQNKSVAYLSNLWKQEQLNCIRHSNSLMESGILMRISYEQLISDEGRVLDELCHFLGADRTSPKQQQSGKENTEIQEWQNLKKPTMRGNTGKFRQELSAAAIRKIESICWHQMLWLGYETVNNERPDFSKARAAVEATSGEVSRVLRARLLKQKGVTTEQMDRIQYIKSLRSRWR